MSEALITAITALIDSRIAAAVHALTPPAQNTSGTAGVSQSPAQPPVPDPFAGLGGGVAQQPAQPEVTPKMLQELIMPMIADPATKSRLSAVMQELGIPELPAAKPGQLPVLYARFKAIADEASGAQANTGTATGGII